MMAITPIPKLLLTPELRKEVMDKIEECYVKCEKHYGKTFVRPEVQFNIRNTHAGTANYATNLIRFNLTFLVENKEAFIARTPGHEVAHLVANAVYSKVRENGKKVRPHGAEWKEVMGVIGQKAEVYHQFEVLSLDIHRKPRKNRMVTKTEKLQRILVQLSRFEPEDIDMFISKLSKTFYGGVSA